MRLAHVADVHLGRVLGNTWTVTGRNQRSADISRGFTNLVDALLICEPDIVVIAGDFFDQTRPRNYELLHAMAELQRLRSALPDAIVAMVAGNHDAARDNGAPCVLPIFRQLGIHVADREAVRLTFPDRDLSILCVPDAPGIGRPELRPNLEARYNVLLMHGEVAGVNQLEGRTGLRITDVSLEELGAPEWDYVALGHYHQYEQVAENAWYSGSIDFTSTDVWAEAKGPKKGFIVHDLVDHAHEFIELPPTRRVIDLPRVYGNGLEPAAIDAAIANALDSIEGGCDDAIIRLVITGVTRETQTALDIQKIRRYRARCLHFRLDLRRPEPVSIRSALGISGRRRKSLDEIVRDGLLARELPDGIDRGRLVETTMEYLTRAHEYVVQTYGANAAGPSPDQWAAQSPEPETASEPAPTQRGAA